jgi:hypothetical protein
MGYSKLNKEETIRKYVSGELSSQEHIEVGDLIREDPEWKRVSDRQLRAQQRHSADFAGSSIERPVTDARNPNTSQTPTTQESPTDRTNQPNQEAWWRKFLSGWGIWIAIFVLMRFGSCALKSFNDVKDRLQNQFAETTKTAAADENPIATDLAARYGNPEDSLSHLIPLCTENLQKAAKFQKDGRTQRYVEELLEIGSNEASPCHNEALYLAAKTTVENGDAFATRQIISRITDIDNFNADTQWLIAKTFVIEAKIGEIPAAKAKRAIDRALAFPENEKYRTEAEQMMSELGEEM